MWTYIFFVLNKLNKKWFRNGDSSINFMHSQVSVKPTESKMRVLNSLPSKVIFKMITTGIFLVSFLQQVQSARICVFSVVGFMNYRSAYDTLLEALVDKGHEVTVFSTLPLHVSNESYRNKIRFIRPQSVVSHLDSFFSHVSPMEWRQKGKQHVLWDMLPILTLDICDMILKDKEAQQWIRGNSRYDLFIVDSAWNECGIAISHIFHAKLILFSLHSNLLSWNVDSLGAASETAWVPDSQYASSGHHQAPPSFLQKIHFSFRSLRWYIYRNSFSFYQVNKFCKRFLKSDVFPSIRDIEQNASLFLINSHFSEEYARSLPPVFVPVGGVHIRSPTAASKAAALKNSVVKRVENFVAENNSSTGFMLMNLGCSKDNLINLPTESKQAILSAMRETTEIMKFVLIWPTDKDNKAGSAGSQFVFSSDALPKNVLIVEECTPALNAFALAHPQIKGFISQGDLLDVQEAVYHAVPLILLPVVFEQDANAERVERMGRGIQLEITKLKKEHLVDAVNQLFHNSTYTANMKAASAQFRDRQVHPLDSTLWWIEYTLRNNNIGDKRSSLKPLGMHQNWFARRSLDVWLFIILCILASVTLIVLLLVISSNKSAHCNSNSSSNIIKMKIK